MTEKTPERRLLKAIVTLNAINHGRSIPDRDKIKGGFVIPLGSAQDDEVLKAKLKEALEAAGIKVTKGKPSGSTDKTSEQN